MQYREKEIIKELYTRRNKSLILECEIEDGSIDENLINENNLSSVSSSAKANRNYFFRFNKEINLDWKGIEGGIGFYLNQKICENTSLEIYIFNSGLCGLYYDGIEIESKRGNGKYIVDMMDISNISLFFMNIIFALDNGLKITKGEFSINNIKDDLFTTEYFFKHDPTYKVFYKGPEHFSIQFSDIDSNNYKDITIKNMEMFFAQFEEIGGNPNEYNFSKLIQN